VSILGRRPCRDDVIDDRRLSIRIVGDVAQGALDHRRKVAREAGRPFRRVERDAINQRGIEAGHDLGNPLSDEVIPWARPHRSGQLAGSGSNVSRSGYAP
jgi:hypothetical protein